MLRLLLQCPSGHQPFWLHELRHHLIVHHGLLWGGNRTLVGAYARKLGKCFANGLAVYAAHLPLDVHREVGNNIGLLRALGLSPVGPFGRYQTIEIGLAAACDLGIDELCVRIESSVGACRRFGRGAARIRRLAVITGGAGSYVAAAANAGFDALIVGEAPHHAAIEAQERGIHLLLAGHYRTEVFGVRALGARLAEQFGVSCVFVGHDTGL